jgi:hypothetical protein
MLNYMYGLFSSTNLSQKLVFRGFLMQLGASNLVNTTYVDYNWNSDTFLPKPKQIAVRAQSLGSLGARRVKTSPDKSLVFRGFGRALDIVDAATGNVLAEITLSSEIHSGTLAEQAISCNQDNSRLIVALANAPFIAAYDISNPSFPIDITSQIGAPVVNTYLGVHFTKESPNRLVLMRQNRDLVLLESDLSLSATQPSVQPGFNATGVMANEQFVIVFGNNAYYLRTYNLTDMTLNAAPSITTSAVSVLNIAVEDNKALLRRSGNSIAVVIDLISNQEIWASAANSIFQGNALIPCFDYWNGSIYVFNISTSFDFIRSFNIATQTITDTPFQFTFGYANSPSACFVPNGSWWEPTDFCVLTAPQNSTQGFQEWAPHFSISNHACRSFKYIGVEYYSDVNSLIQEFVLSKDKQHLYAFLRLNANAANASQDLRAVFKIDLSGNQIAAHALGWRHVSTSTSNVSYSGVSGFEHGDWIYHLERTGNSNNHTRISRYNANTLAFDAGFDFNLAIDFPSVGVGPLNYYDDDFVVLSAGGAAQKLVIYDIATFTVQYTQTGSGITASWFSKALNSERILIGRLPNIGRPELYESLLDFINAPSSPLFSWKNDIDILGNNIPCFFTENDSVILTSGGNNVGNPGRKYDAQTFSFLNLTSSGTGPNNNGALGFYYVISPEDKPVFNALQADTNKLSDSQKLVTAQIGFRGNASFSTTVLL